MSKMIIALKYCLTVLGLCVVVAITAQPSMLAPDTLSSAYPEFATTYAFNGQKVYFNRTTSDRQHIYLLESTRGEQGWQEPVLAPFADSLYRYIDPFVTQDGQTLYFSSNRPVGTRTDFNLWYCTHTKAGWSTPKMLPDGVNSWEDEIYTTVALNRNLYFSRYEGSKAAIYFSVFKDGVYQPAQKVVLPIHDSVSYSNPCISPDEKWLIFCTTQLRSLGSGDLFICGKTADGAWSAPNNLTLINTKWNEFAPSFSADGKYLYFTSERPGIVQDFPEGKRRPGDLYQIPWLKILGSMSKRF